MGTGQFWQLLLELSWLYQLTATDTLAPHAHFMPQKSMLHCNASAVDNWASNTLEITIHWYHQWKSVTF